MSPLSKEQIGGLGVAFNEASLLGVELDVSRSLCGITLSVLSLPAEGPPTSDSRLQVLLAPVGRLCASLRHGLWNDDAAPVEIFPISELLPKVQSFGGRPIYGWEFIDVDNAVSAYWSNRLSLDWQGDPNAQTHTLTLFQECFTPERTLDLKIWFREISFYRPTGEKVEIEDVITGGKRWWDGMYSGDSRTNGIGIGPLKSPAAQPPPPR
jgi:hypothetical protein